MWNEFGLNRSFSFSDSLDRERNKSAPDETPLYIPYILLQTCATKEFRLIFALFNFCWCCCRCVSFRTISLPFTEFHTCHFAQHLNLLSFWMFLLFFFIQYTIHVYTLDDCTTHSSFNTLLPFLLFDIVLFH